MRKYWIVLLVIVLVIGIIIPINAARKQPPQQQVSTPILNIGFATGTSEIGLDNNSEKVIGFNNLTTTTPTPTTTTTTTKWCGAVPTSIRRC